MKLIDASIQKPVIILYYYFAILLSPDPEILVCLFYLDYSRMRAPIRSCQSVGTEIPVCFSFPEITLWAYYKIASKEKL